MIGGRRPLQGRKPADRRVRVERPHAPFFRYLGPGQLVAKPAANVEVTSTGRFLARVRGVVFGRPLSNEEEIGERLSKTKALAIFSSDAISSSAYATEEILRVLLLAGASALFLSLEVSIAITVLLAVVSVSYRQVCRAYPNGGGAYIVARTNLAPIFGLIAAAALLIDYVMTVSVSTAAAIAQIQSVWPPAYDIRIEIAFVSISLITIANLRGLRESGNIFAVPTYAFVVLALGIVAIGLVNIIGGTVVVPPQPDAQPFPQPLEAVGILLLLKAFAGGSVALTGVEAIANGVPAFKPPESKNAANTMTAMAILLGILFVGLTLVAVQYGLRPTNPGGASIVALAAQATFGDGSVLFVTFAVSTALILFLAANTSFNAFPRLAAILAGDGYMPRQFSFRGDRLAYSWGIVLLAAVAFGLLWAFGGDTHALIPLYSVGVFLCFTLSQLGMVRHWLRGRRDGLALAAGRQCGRRHPDRDRAGHRRDREVRRRRLPGRHPRPGPRRDDAVHQPAVRAVDPAARRGPGARRPAAASGGAGHRPDPGPESGRRPGDQRRRARSTTTSGPCSSPTTSPPRPACARRSSARSPGSRWSSSSRRTARSPGRCLPTSTCSTRPGPPGKAAPITFVVIPEYVARQLVGADPLQPVGEAAAGGAAGAAADRRRRGPIPARGGGTVRVGARRRAPRRATATAARHAAGPAAEPGART